VVADSELDAPRLTSEVTTLLSDDGRLAALARASLSFGTTVAAMDVMKIAASIA